MRSAILLGLVLSSGAVPQGLAQSVRTFDVRSPGAFTHWTVEHDKEDGSGNDICIMTAAWPGRPVSFSIRKDTAKDYYALRFLDPAAAFAYNVPTPVALTFDGDLLNRRWNGPASGIGPVFDFRLPTGPSFSIFEGQLLTAHSVTVAVAGHSWTGALVDVPRAYAMMQDCVVNASISEGRW